MKSDEAIIDRGRGPEIRGTRITVYSIIDYLLEGWHPDRIAAWFRLSSGQVQAVIDYIREHTLEVITEYQKILERSARGNPPEVQARADESHRRFQVLMGKVRQVEDTDPEVRREKIAALIAEHRQGTGQGGADGGDNGRP